MREELRRGSRLEGVRELFRFSAGFVDAAPPSFIVLTPRLRLVAPVYSATPTYIFDSGKLRWVYE
jgi:hypothetical protein